MLRRVFAILSVVALASLAVAPVAFARHTITMRFPKFVVQPRSDYELCTFVRLPTKVALDIAGTSIVNIGVNPTFTSHHFLMWAYEGTDLESFPPAGQLVASKACLDFGPTDTNNRSLIGGSQSPRLRTKLPDGLAQQVKPTVAGSGRSEIGIILNSHWINAADHPQRAAVKVKLFTAKRHTVRRYLLPMFEVVANAWINVPPHQVKTAAWFWEPGGISAGNLGGGAVPTGPACVVGITSHMHKRGKLFTADFVDRRHSNTAIKRLLANANYADPPQVSFGTDPLLVNPGFGLQYECTHDNGVTTAVKLGCEEQPGVPPGVDAFTALFSHLGTSGAAKRCSQVGPDPQECPPTDDKYPRRTFTGNCVEANLVFGYTSDDDMCILPGTWYPANDQGNCDISGLPILN